MVHDFVVTTKHVIFPIFPLIIDFNLAAQGKFIAWDANRPSQIESQAKRWNSSRYQMDRERSLLFHPMNAFEEDGKIITDMMQFEEAPMFPS